MISDSSTTQNLMDEDDVDTLFNIDLSQTPSRRSVMSRASTVSYKFPQQRSSTVYYDLSNDPDHKRISIMSPGRSNTNFPPGRRSSMAQQAGTFLESRKINHSKMYRTSLNSVEEEKGGTNRLSTKKYSVTSGRKKSSTE